MKKEGPWEEVSQCRKRNRDQGEASMLKMGGGEYVQKISSNKGMSICHILVNKGEIYIFCYQEILHIKNTDPKLEKEELVYDRPATLLGSRSLVL